MAFYRSWIVAVLAAMMSLTALGAEREDILIADFEGRDYGAWKAEGEAFGAGPARGTLPNQMAVDGFLGKGLVNSYLGGDRSTGRLTSPPLVIQRRYLNFLIGGGMNPGKTCINLRREGQVVRTATGPNDRPGGSERLDWQSWDVADLAGQSVTLEIVDQATGGWGHINIDQIVQGDRRKGALLRDARREIALEKRYLNLPVKTGAPKRRMSVAIDGRVAREFEIELADAQPDFWAFLDISAFSGKRATLSVDRLPDDSQALAAVEQGDDIKGSADLYREPLRPQFHFSSRRGWLNDPNGLVFYRGEYHLYYQHNPYGWDWGNMHWGHAVSADLVHWRELPIALYPHRFGDWAFSGSAVVDRANISGFKKGDEEVIVAAYTSTGRGECIVYSNDRGRTFTEYEGNPVVKHQGRDPKLIWHDGSKQWVMAVYDEQGNRQGIAFYTSPDLKQWTRQSWIDGYFECPEIFSLSVDGDARQVKWVLYAADGAYALGAFDGKTFTVESGKHPANWGNCFYASQTYSDIPPADGRRIRVGWGRVTIPGMPFNQMMNFPVELTLRKTDEGPRLFAMPVREIATLRTRSQEIRAQALSVDANPLESVNGELLDIDAELEVGSTGEIRFTVRGVPITYDMAKQVLACADKRATLKPVDGRLRLRMLVDRTSIEIFGNDGRIYMPMGVLLKSDHRSLDSRATGSASIVRMQVHELRSAWR